MDSLGFLWLCHERSTLQNRLRDQQFLELSLSPVKFGLVYLTFKRVTGSESSICFSSSVVILLFSDELGNGSVCNQLELGADVT